MDVTRAEIKRIITILNTRAEILDALTEAVAQLRRDSDQHFRRLAQLQGELDVIRIAWDRTKRS